LSRSAILAFLDLRLVRGKIKGLLLEWSIQLKKYLERYAFLFTIAGLIITLDQWTKYLVRSNLAFQETWSPWAWLSPYARIVHWKNTGAAFGIFQNLNTVFAVLAVVVTIAIIYFFPRVEKGEWPLRIALSMQMGGALGNLIDRLTQGYVTDFVSLGRFAVFNVADASISMGVAVLVVGVWLTERKHAAAVQKKGEDEQTEADIVQADYEERQPVE
jgi:signal peptidase II